jgi:hypothetical protein
MAEWFKPADGRETKQAGYKDVHFRGQAERAEGEPLLQQQTPEREIGGG